MAGCGSAHTRGLSRPRPTVTEMSVVAGTLADMSASAGETLSEIELAAMTRTPGYVYVLQFDNGVIKAGRTEDPHGRSERHVRDSGRYGLTILRRWFSDRLNDAVQRERLLITALNQIGERTSAGREYFRGVPFAIARHLAQRPPSDVCRECGRPGMRMTVEMRLPATVAAAAVVTSTVVV
jgi:predicted GIY-YIG superfamily endonuclease